MVLYIDTSDLRTVSYKLLEGKTEIAAYTASIDPYTSHTLLAHLATFLKQNSVSPQNLDGRIHALLFFSGQGSHTGLRVGLAIAQGLALGWRVPIKTTKVKK